MDDRRQYYITNDTFLSNAFLRFARAASPFALCVLYKKYCCRSVQYVLCVSVKAAVHYVDKRVAISRGHLWF